MGLRPTQGNESQFSVTPAKAGVNVGKQLDSRFRGNNALGVIFKRAEPGISLCLGSDHGRKSQGKIPRFARNDRVGRGFRRVWWRHLAGNVPPRNKHRGAFRPTVRWRRNGQTASAGETITNAKLLPDQRACSEK